MNRTEPTSPFRKVSHQDTVPAFDKSMDDAPGRLKRFLFQLEGYIQKHNYKDAENTITSCRSIWSALCAQDVAELVELAMKCGARTLVELMVRHCEPGKAAAMPLETQVNLIWGRCKFGTSTMVLDLLTKDAICPEDHRERLIDAYGYYMSNLHLTQTPAEIKATFGQQKKVVQPYRQKIYEAALTGSAHDLQNALDSALGLPPLDDSLTGTDWILNRLHRWFMETLKIGDTKQLVNEQIANMPLLHAAVKSGDAEKVRLLIEKGARLSSKDKNDHTALWRAKEDRNQALVSLLEGYGAEGTTHRPCTYWRPERKPIGQESFAVGFPTFHTASALRMSWQDTAQLFSELLPDVASSFSNFKLLQANLNTGVPLSSAQAELLTAGYLAEFEPEQTLKGTKSSRVSASEMEDLADELERSQVLFQFQGKKCEHEKAAAIQLALDMGFSIRSKVSDAIIDKLRSDLQEAGLCNVLIDAVIAALDTACKDKSWEYMARTGKKHAMTVLLAKKLTLMQKALATPGQNGSDLALYGRLLLRQISVLDLYCKAAQQVCHPIWSEVRDN